MHILERLQQLRGHEVHINVLHASEDDASIPGGILEEIGSDYLTIQTKSDKEGGFVEEPAQWFVTLASISSLFHPGDCPTCAVEAAQAMHRPTK